jgi:hypothetical protein
VANRIACLLWLATTVSATAAQPFDGSWQVNVATQNGSCGAYSSEIVITEGRIVTPPGVLISGSGNVSPAGRIAVEFIAGTSSIKASGQAKRSSAQGQWLAPSLSCSGNWRAYRR